MKSLVWMVLRSLLVSVLSGCACVERCKIATGPTPFVKYEIPVYATESVPFEYTEIGIVQIAPTQVGSFAEVSKYMEEFVGEAKRLGADAVINFHVTRFATAGGFMLVLPNCRVEMEGVAVKIKRP